MLLFNFIYLPPLLYTIAIVFPISAFVSVGWSLKHKVNCRSLNILCEYYFNDKSREFTNKLDLLYRTISGFQISSWSTLSWDTFPNFCLSQTRSLSIHLSRMYTSVTSTRFFSSISAWITLIPTFTVVLLMLWIMCFPLSYFEKIDSLRLSLNVFESHNVVMNARKEISIIWMWYAPFWWIMIKMSPINNQNLPCKQRTSKTSLPSILQSIVIWKDIQSTISQSMAHPLYINVFLQYNNMMHLVWWCLYKQWNG